MSYFYVATPYSKYPLGIDEAWREACRQTALLIQAGVPVFSPIAHTHPISLEGGMDPLDHSIWMPLDAPMMENARGIIVVMMAGWATSYGVELERGYFRQAGKPEILMEPSNVPPWMFNGGWRT